MGGLLMITVYATEKQCKYIWGLMLTVGKEPKWMSEMTRSAAAEYIKELLERVEMQANGTL